MKRRFLPLLCLVVLLLFGFLIFWLAQGAETRSAAQVTWFGAAGQVSGSNALLELGSRKYLVDIGSHYREHMGEGARQTGSLVPPAEEEDFAFDPEEIHAVFLTHAHLDHAGRLPELYRKGFRGTVYVAPPAKPILEVMLEMQIRYDGARQRSWEWSRYLSENKDHFTAHWNHACPWKNKIKPYNKMSLQGSFYDLQKEYQSSGKSIGPCKVCAGHELRPVMQLFTALPYGERKVLDKNTSVSFLDAKHIPGSSSIAFEAETGENQKMRVIFSGDLGSDMSRFLPEPAAAPASHHVFVEATYGDDSRTSTPDAEYKKFIHEIDKTLENGGIVWIPSFALDRSQRILYEIASARQGGLLQKVTDIYLPSPTARKITELYIDNPGWHNPGVSSVLDQIYSSVYKGYLNTDHFNPRPGSLVVTTAGMMDTGASLGLIPHLLPRDDVLLTFVGYQSPFTYGGQLKGSQLRRPAETVTIDGKLVRRAARVKSFSNFSGHGDADDIDRWLKHNRKAKIYLVHGEDEMLRSRQKDLNSKGFADVTIVGKSVTYRLE